MRLHLLAAAAVFLPSASSLQIAPIEERTTTPYTPQCGVKGTYLLPTIWGSKQLSLTVPAQCGALCKANTLCRSYAVDSTTCYLYLLPVTSFVRKPSTGPLTYYDTGCTTATDLCWVNGKPYYGTKTMKSSSYFLDNSWTGCSDLCKKTAGCKSYTLGTGACTLYGNTVAKTLVTDSRSPQAFWDVNCPLSAATLPPPPVGPVHDVSQASQVSVVPVPKSFSPVESFVPYVTDSPALAAMDQPKYGGYGDDHTFTDSYTYEQYDLPTVTATGVAPATTGFRVGGSGSEIPSAPCMISSGPDAQVTLLSEDFIPLVSKASSQLGPAAQPTSQPAASDPLSQHPEYVQLPLFYFKSPASGPAGTYDLVYAPTSQYVALQENGNVVLRPGSTGPNFVGGYATTIFQTACNGALTISQGGSTWIWSTNGATTKMTKGTPTKSFRALPHDHPFVQEARKHRKRSLELARKIEARGVAARGVDQEGGAPRCPNKQGFPTDLVAHYKQGFKFGEGNLCDNMHEAWQFSPFDFGAACGVQSLCYDLCESFKWETCNYIFNGLSLLSCAQKFKNWWDVIPAIACVAQATYFTVEANLQKGRETFYKAQDAMCGCFCRDGLDQCRSNKLASGFECINTKAIDNENCGTCGRTCPPRTTCKGNGNCGCLGDQCGGTCLDLRNNPNNCGKCGNVCDPKYCVAGQCYKPDPSQCAPDPPLASDAPDVFAPWRYSDVGQPECKIGSQISIYRQFLISDQDYRVQTYKYTDMPGSGCSGTARREKIKVCPGFKYELKFYGIYLKDFNEGGVVFKTGAKCYIQWGLGPPSGTDFGPYQRSQNWQVTKTSGFEGFGPWTFSVTKDGAGVTKQKNGPDYYVDLYSLVTCSDGQNGAISIEGVDIQQVGTA